MQRAGVPMPDAGLVPTNGPDSSNASFAVPSTRRGQLIRWAAIAAAVLAVSEAVLIGRLVYGRTAWSPPKTMVRAMEPKTGSVVDAGGPSAPAPAANDRQDRASAQRLSAVAAALDRAIAPTVDTTQAPMAAAPRRGGFRISSAIELHVLDGERLVGSSGDGPIITTAGSREFEFVNSAIGYRLRRTVDIKAGQITPISVTVPNGSLNINATPWAEVWIDGTPYGQTPLGNVSISPGEHLIRFRHPQLGERWERTIVRSDMPARVSVNLQR